MAELKPSKYEPLLKEDLVCFRCNKPQKNMPTFKAHLQTEWDGLRNREKTRLEKLEKRNQTNDGTASAANITGRKREREAGSGDAEESDTGEISASGRKRRELDTES